MAEREGRGKTAQRGAPRAAPIAFWLERYYYYYGGATVKGQPGCRAQKWLRQLAISRWWSLSWWSLSWPSQRRASSGFGKRVPCFWGLRHGGLRGPGERKKHGPLLAKTRASRVFFFFPHPFFEVLPFFPLPFIIFDVIFFFITMSLSKLFNLFNINGSILLLIENWLNNCTEINKNVNC